jgi:hypothetical protein
MTEEEEKKEGFKKRFIVYGIIAIVGVIFVFDRITNKQITNKEAETEVVFERYLNEADSAITVLDNTKSVIDSLSIADELGQYTIDSLGQSLIDKNMTIEQYTKRLEYLLGEANRAKEEAETQKRLAQEMEEMATQAKMVAEKEKMRLRQQYNKLLIEYNRLKKQGERKSVPRTAPSPSNNIKRDTIPKKETPKTVIKEEGKKKNKKKKRN